MVFTTIQMHCLKKYFQQCLCSLPSKGLAYFLMHRFLTTQESWSKCNFLETKREKAPFFVRKLIQTLLSNKWQVYFMKKFSSFFQFQSILLLLISYLGSIYRKLCNHCCNLMKVIHNQKLHFLNSCDMCIRSYFETSIFKLLISLFKSLAK